MTKKQPRHAPCHDGHAVALRVRALAREDLGAGDALGEEGDVVAGGDPGGAGRALVHHQEAALEARQVQADAARVGSATDRFRVVCTPSGEGRSVWLELPGDWEERCSDQEILEAFRSRLG